MKKSKKYMLFAIMVYLPSGLIAIAVDNIAFGWWIGTFSGTLYMALAD